MNVAFFSVQSFIFINHILFDIFLIFEIHKKRKT